jgi:predicted nicotinamide N-methyase
MTMPGYQTKLQTVAIAGVDDLVICSLLDHQQFFDPSGAALRLGICSASWPLFGLLWPSGAQLAAQLAQRPVCPEERILEIGCGLALASLVGHRRGARVTASDRHPLAREFLDNNARLNRLAPLTYRHGQWGATYEPDMQDAGAELLSARYDLIIGSDLLYEPSMPEALACFIDDHAAPDAEVWVVDPDRGYRTAFNRQLAGYGFQLRQDERLWQPAPLGEGTRHEYRGRLLVYQR